MIIFFQLQDFVKLEISQTLALDSSGKEHLLVQMLLSFVQTIQVSLYQESALVLEYGWTMIKEVVARSLQTWEASSA